MGSRYGVEVTIVSAEGLENVNRRHSLPTPYAVVWVDLRSKYTTGVDYLDQKLEIPFNTPIDDSYLYIDVVHAESAEGTKQLVLVGSARLPLRDVALGEPAVNKKLELMRPSGSPHGKVDVKVAVRETRYHAPHSYYGQATQQQAEHKRTFGRKPKGYCVAILRTLFGKIKLDTGGRVAANDSLEDWVWVENPLPPPERVVHVDKEEAVGDHKEEAADDYDEDDLT